MASSSYDAIRFEFELELKKDAALKKETMEMVSEIWSRLPLELLLLVLAKLPTLIMRRFRAVCKRWKYLLSPAVTFKRILSTVSPYSSPAILIIGQHLSLAARSHIDDLHLLQSSPTRLPLDFLPHASRIVQASCRSLLCCFSYVKGKPTSFYICNPVTRTWKTLSPSPTPLSPLREGPHFIGLAFDTTTRICILLMGLINKINEERNNVVIHMYGSETDTWTELEMNIPISISPKGEGIYSRGKFYWMSRTRTRVGEHTIDKSDVATFDVAKKCWDVIGLPERPILEHTQYQGYWKLTGYDGKMVLVDHKDLSLWKLNEDEENAGNKWLELQAFPRSLYEEAEKDSKGTGLKAYHADILVHSCGWVLVHLFGNKMVVFGAEGRVLRCIEGHLLSVLERDASPMLLRAYELNNIWWP